MNRAFSDAFDIVDAVPVSGKAVLDHAVSINKDTGRPNFTPDERMAFIQQAARWFVNLKDDAHRYDIMPVDPQTFVESNAYLGRRGIVYPAVMREIVRLNNGLFVEAVLTGAIGTGKTTIALFTTAFQLYLLSCLKNPHKDFDLDPASEILFVFQSLNAKVAKDNDYVRFRVMLADSPYFNKFFPFDKTLESEMHFPKRVIIRPLSSKTTASIGSNLIGGIIDEINFMSVIEKSKQATDGGTFDQANEIYSSIASRRESRFMAEGRTLPGMLCLVSSRRYPGEFTDRKTDQALEQIAKNGKTGIFIYDKRLWDIKPDGTYSTNTFNLFLGDAGRKPRVLDEDEEMSTGDARLIMAVPINFRHRFDEDLLLAIREIAGSSTFALHPYIVNTEAITRGFGNRQSVLSVPKTDFVTSRPMIYPNRIFKPNEPRLAHVDLGITGDSAGVAIGYIDRFVSVPRGDNTSEMMPRICFDLVLEVPPPKNGEIEFESIRRMFYKLREQGMNLKWITFDTFQSRDSVQLLRQKGFTTGSQSMDVDSIPYDVTKSAFYDGRIDAPAHEQAASEFVRLERDPKTGKIDHPPNWCFTGETRVALADGTNPTFVELAERYKPDETFYVYSIDKKGVCIAPARNSRVTMQAKELVEVELDNFQVIRCTPNHLFMTLDGEWIKAESLTPDVPIMPLYRTVDRLGGVAGYERLWCPVRNTRILTHHLSVGAPMPGYIVHHKDENKRNNSPTNLEHMTRGSHFKHHGDALWHQRVDGMREGFAAHFSSSEARDVARARLCATWASGKLGPRALPCSIEGCGATSKAKGMCDKHYQSLKRAKTRALRHSKQVNHRVLSVRRVVADEPVYDITVPGLENFALAAGVFVHNSKDCSDAMAGVVYGLTYRRELWVRHGVSMRDITATVAAKLAKKDEKSDIAAKAGMHRHVTSLDIVTAQGGARR